MLELYYVEKYDEELFTNLFDVTNKIEIGKIHIKFNYWSLINEGVENVCAKFYKKIRSLKTQNIVSNEVSCFIVYYFIT